MQQVVLNLVLNAVQAMSTDSDGLRDLLISTEQSQEDGVLVAVRDSGPGIDPDMVERVFHSFYTTKPSGMGMGLSICRSIVDAHGGRLEVNANSLEAPFSSSPARQPGPRIMIDARGRDVRRSAYLTV